MQKATCVAEFEWLAARLNGAATVIVLVAFIEWISILHTAGVYLVFVSVESIL